MNNSCTSFVSSEKNKYQQVKLNNVIQSLSDFVNCTTNDCTKQEYGEINYFGPISIGQIICGNKKPRKQNVPVITTNNIFLGYLDPNGTITVKNNKQIVCSKDKSEPTRYTLLSAEIFDHEISEYNCCQLEKCSYEPQIPIQEPNKLTTMAVWKIETSCRECCNMQQCIERICANNQCIGSGCTSFIWGGENCACIYAKNVICFNGRVCCWNGDKPVAEFDILNQTIKIFENRNRDFIDCCLQALCASYYSTLCNCKNGLCFYGNTCCINCYETTYQTTSANVCISEKYV